MFTCATAADTCLFFLLLLSFLFASPEICDFVLLCLRKNPAERPRKYSVLRTHPFLQRTPGGAEGPTSTAGTLVILLFDAT